MTSYFQPNIIPIGSRLYVLADTWTYRWYPKETLDVESLITVPEGFVYDGASIPRITWSLFGVTPDGVHRAAALVHDWIYTFDGDLPPGSVMRKITMADGSIKVLDTIDKWTRKDADRFFKKMLLETDMKRWKVECMYNAVRWFGWIKWK